MTVTPACRSRCRLLFSTANPGETGFGNSLPRRCAYGEFVQSRRFFASASSNTCKFRGVPMVNRYSRDVSLHRRAAAHVNLAVFFASASSSTCKFRGVPMVNWYSRDVSLHR